MKIDNPAFNYDTHGGSYPTKRRTDPRIAQQVNDALGQAQTILNVGAGAGSYEPHDRYVIAVEPSPVMRAQRLANNKVPAVNATAGKLPFSDKSFDAAMALVTVHHWPDIEKGLQEMRRVTKGPIVIMSFDPDALDLFWNARYFPRLIEVERARYPKIGFLTSILSCCRVIPVPVPLDCADGFQEAFYGRPEAFLDAEVRRNQSAWGFLPEGLEDQYVRALATELDNGEWDRKFGGHRTMETFTGALRLVVSEY